MKLEGMHHIAMITGDARKNVEFYPDVLGLRQVKATASSRLGEELRLPSRHEHLRPQLEQLLTPLANPRAARRAEARP